MSKDSTYVAKLKDRKDYSCSGMQIILNMIANGSYSLGEDYRLGYYDDPHYAKIDDYSEDKISDAICHFLISYGRCKFEDVPEKARTREFYLNSFTDKDVYKYIESHINEFDREFFKDLFATNHYALIFEDNAFEIMPLEYIDSEMVDIAFLNALDWNDSDWFQTVVRRKPEVITYQAWLCAARYYASVYNVLNNVPDEYKTETFYLEIMSCCYNVRMPLTRDKEKTIEQIPDSIMTPDFLKNVLCLDLENIGRIPEKYMDTMLDFRGKKVSVWEVGIIADSKIITLIEPTWERIKLFKDRYGDSSFYYNLYCKDIEEKLKAQEATT